MKVEQIYTGCLAQGAYYIESEGEAVIIDPLREVQPYIQLAARRQATIKYVLETHFHADFVSGHIDLAKKTGASIIYGPTDMQIGFEAIIAHDGQEFMVGKARIRAIHTPGHTLESTCYLLIDEAGVETALFTGDTLFIGDVGRPDLAQKLVSDLTQEMLASMLYDSLRNKVMPLADTLIVYPAHGAGSACGKMMSKETTDTLGNQKNTNYALRADMTKEVFIKEVLDGLKPPPNYFPQNVMMNIQGYDSIDTVLERGTKALLPAEFEAVANETQAVLLDTRDAQTFAKGFIPNAINIGIDGSFAVWVGTLIADPKQPILIIAAEGREEEIITRLARVGYDFALGYLKGGFEAWQNADYPIDTITSISPEKAAELITEQQVSVLDVRKESEYNTEHILHAKNTPLDFINESMLQIDKNKTYYVHCAGGYRSMVFVSILQARGYRNLIEVQGGFNALKACNKCTLTNLTPQNTAL